VAEADAVRCRDLEKLYDEHRHDLESIPDLKERNRRLVEMHVWSQAKTLLETLARKPQFAETMPEVHAFVYDASEKACVMLRS
jgi:carbonic anhydrase